MKRIFILIFFIPCILLGQNSYNKSAISKKVQNIAKEIAKENVLMSSAIGGAGTRPEQYDRFEDLSKTATLPELKELTNHPNGVVRCYAFYAICDKGESGESILRILENHINDGETIETFSGCIMSIDMISDVMAGHVIYGYGDDSPLNSSQLQELDSLLVYKGNEDSYFRSLAIEKIPATPANYTKVKQLATKEESRNTLIKLSEYKRKEDLDYLYGLYHKLKKKDELGTFYIIAANYADPIFFPILKSDLEQTMSDDHFSNQWADLYTAIAAYKNKEALDLLYMPFTKIVHNHIKKYHLNFVQRAVDANRDKMYDAVLWKLWEEYNLINQTDYEYLKQADPEKAYKAALSNFTLTHDNDVAPELEMIFLDDIMKRDSALANTIITKQIKETDVHRFKLYAAIVQKDPQYTEALFERLQQEDNPHVYIPLIETLASYDNQKVNKRILEALKANPHLTEGWGGRELDEFLKKNKIK